MVPFLRPLRRLSAALAAAAAFAMPAGAVPTVSFSGSSLAAPGGLLNLGVVATDFADLYAYQFDVVFDRTAFAATGVAEGTFLPALGTTFFDPGLADNAAGTVTFVLGSLVGPGAGATGSGSLAQFTFLALAGFAGSATFSIANVLAFDSALEPIAVAVQGLTVSPVPEPSVLLLSAAGLALLGSGRAARAVRRRSSPAAA